MCRFIQHENVMPGYICCAYACHSYNGLQRSCFLNGDYRTLCQYYANVKTHGIGKGNCALEIPGNVIQCAHCLAGYEKKADGTPDMPLADGTGKRFNERFCPVCNRPFVAHVNRSEQVK